MGVDHADGSGGFSGRPAEIAIVVGARHLPAHRRHHRLEEAEMKPDSATLITLLLHFGLLSIAAVGGGNSAIPEIHRQAVEVSGWLTEREVADIFAISTAAPGPNFMISTLVGYRVAGPIGARVATLGMCGPSSVLAYYVRGTWEKFKYARWRMAIQTGLIPISIGLIGSAGIIVA